MRRITLLASLVVFVCLAAPFSAREARADGWSGWTAGNPTPDAACLSWQWLQGPFMFWIYEINPGATEPSGATCFHQARNELVAPVCTWPIVLQKSALLSRGLSNRCSERRYRACGFVDPDSWLPSLVQPGPPGLVAGA